MRTLLLYGVGLGVVALGFAIWFFVAPNTSRQDALVQGCENWTDAKQGIDICTQAILADKSLDPTTRAIVLTGRAAGYSDQARYEEALGDLAAAVAADPKSAVPVTERGLLRIRLGDYATAIKDYSEAIGLDSKFANPHRGRAWAYLQTGQFEKSIADYNDAIQFDPGRAYDYSNRGSAYAGLGDEKRALEDFATALKLDPQETYAYDRRGLIYQGHGQYDLAKREFDAAMKANPKDYVAFNNRCYNFAILNEVQAALKDCDQSLNLQSATHGITAEKRNDYAGTLDSRGYAYLRSGDFDDAIADYDEALAINPNIAESLFGRAVAYAGKGDMISAERDIVAARQVNPGIDAVMAKVHLTAPSGL